MSAATENLPAGGLGPPVPRKPLLMGPAGAAAMALQLEDMRPRRTLPQ